MGPANSRHVYVFLRIEIRVYRGIEGAVISRRGEEALPLRGELLEKDIVRRRVLRKPAPGTTQLLGNVFRGHGVEYVGVTLPFPYVYADLAQLRSHANRFYDV